MSIQSIDDRVREAVARALSSAQNLSVRISSGMELFPGGTNGPHGALETPVRNTCHWLVTLLRAFRCFGERSHFEQAMRLRAWLLAPDNPFSRYPTFHMRSARGADAVNGVIGAAWLLEALHELVMASGDATAKQRGDDLWAAHVFSSQGVWHRYDPITNRYSIDYTYDHQAWLAAVAADWGGAAAGAARASLDALHRGALEIRSDGRIGHLYRSRAPRALVLRAFYQLRERVNPGFQAELEHGYQLYSLYPLARLKRHFPAHPLFASAKLERALSYCKVDRLLTLKTNRFGYAYNAPGLELPVVFRAFSESMPLGSEDVVAVMDDQASVTLDPRTGLYTRNTPDPLTLSARIYELTQLLEVDAKQEARPVHESRSVCVG